MKYHITKNGVPQICKATKKACPLGEHFANLEDAKNHAQALGEAKYGALPEGDIISRIRKIDDEIKKVSKRLEVYPKHEMFTQEEINKKIEKLNKELEAHSHALLMRNQNAKKKVLEDYKYINGKAQRAGLELELLKDEYKFAEEGVFASKVAIMNYRDLINSEETSLADNENMARIQSERLEKMGKFDPKKIEVSFDKRQFEKDAKYHKDNIDKLESVKPLLDEKLALYEQLKGELHEEITATKIDLEGYFDYLADLQEKYELD